MLDALSLDQLRTFVTVANEGSFSAAARKLNRVQSAVSDLIAKLEANIGVPLFDRSNRYPTLTNKAKCCWPMRAPSLRVWTKCVPAQKVCRRAPKLSFPW